MAPPPTTFNPSLLQTASKEAVKYRASCDSCQNIKIKCSQEKPTCKRCMKKAVSCVYSPLRRIGRPKKVEKRALENSSHAKSPSKSLPIDLVPDVSLGKGGMEDSNLVTLVASNLDRQSWNAEQPPAESNIVKFPAPHEKSRDATDLPIPETYCYIVILMCTTKLEQSLLCAQTPPPIDIILEADRDVRALMHSLFSCTGHSYEASDTIGKPCRSSNPPVLLNLALLAERVVGIFEQAFRHAATSDLTISRDLQTILAHKSDTTTLSFRSLLNEQSAFLTLEPTYSEVRIGLYMIDEQARSLAMMRILQLRISKLIRMLDEMREVLRVDDQGGVESWDGSSAVLDKAAGNLIGDLIRRMEALQVSSVR